MSLSSKLYLAVAGLAGAAALAGWMIYSSTRQAFDQVDQQRTKAVLAQLHLLLEARKGEIHRQIDQAVSSETLRAILEGQESGAASGGDTVLKEAQTHEFDFLEVVDGQGGVIACAHWPDRAGSKNEWVALSGDWQRQEPFLRFVEGPEGGQLGLIAVRTVIAGEKLHWVIGGRKIGQEFLAALAVPAGMRVLLYLNPEAPVANRSPMSAFGPVASALPLGGLMEKARRQGQDPSNTILWPGTKASAERVHTLPLAGREKDLLAVVLICNSQSELASVTSTITNTGLVAGLLLVLLGGSARWWGKRRVTRPIRRLIEGFRQLGGGNWRFRVHAHSSDEIGQLAHGFNRMARDLALQVELHRQAGRVSAWREMSQELARHLDGPLASMQVATERVAKAAGQSPRLPAKIREDSATLLAQLAVVQSTARCLKEFAAIPAPRPQLVDVSDLMSRILQELDGPLKAAEPAIRCEALLERDLPKVMADPELLHRVLHGLVLNALEAMPEGGVLRVQTGRSDAGVAIGVSDSGRGWSQDEMRRLFVDGDSKEPEGAGWGIAVVQAVVSDVRGVASVESTPGKGTRVSIELPRAAAAGS